LIEVSHAEAPSPYDSFDSAGGEAAAEGAAGSEADDLPRVLDFPEHPPSFFCYFKLKVSRRYTAEGVGERGAAFCRTHGRHLDEGGPGARDAE